MRSTFADGGVGSVGANYFLTWEDSEHAFAALYSAQGRPLAEPSSWLYSDIFAFGAQYRFGSAPGWRFLPVTYVFTGLDSEDNPTYRAFLRAATPTGVLLGHPFVYPTTKAVVEDAAINGSGRFVVVSRECQPCVRRIQIFNDAVRPLTPLLTAEVPQYDNNSSGSLVALDSQGRVLLTWETDLHLASQRIVARLYDERGVPLSPVLTLGSPSTNLLQVPHGLQVLSDGTYVASWIVFSDTHNNTDQLYVEHFDPRTGALDKPVLVAEGNIAGALIALNRHGQGVAVWQTQEYSDGIPVSVAGHFSALRVNP